MDAMATKTKSSRIGSVLGALTDTWQEFCRNVKKDVECTTKITGEVMASTTKLQQLLSSQEKCCKTLLTSHRAKLPLLFDILQYFSKVDHIICSHLLDSIHCLCTTAKRISFLIDAGLLCILTDCLVSATNSFINTKEPYQLEDMFFFFHMLLQKLGSKDKRVVTLSRLSGAVGASVLVLKTYDMNSKVYQPVLQVMKLYSSSAANCNIMAKGSVIPSLVKLIPVCGQKKIQLIKLCLELLAVLCKSKTGAKKALSQGAMVMLLGMFQEWHKSDHRNRHLPMRKSILCVIKACVGFGFGRKSFTTADGFRILYFLGLEGIERKEHDHLLRVLSFVLRKCIKDKKIPVYSQSSAYSFALPSSVYSMCSTERTASEVEDLDEEIVACSEDEEEVSYDDEEDAMMSAGSEEQVRNANSVSATAPTITDVDVYRSDCLRSPPPPATFQPRLESEDDTTSNFCDARRFKEFLQELYMYKEEDDIGEVPIENQQAAIHIPTAMVDTSFETADNISSSETEDAGNTYSPSKFLGSSPLLERLKKFNIIDIAEFDDDDNVDDAHENEAAVQQMWAVEDSRTSFDRSNLSFLPPKSSTSCPSFLSATASTTSRTTTTTNASSNALYTKRSHVCTFKNSHCHVEHVFEFVKIPEPTLYGYAAPMDLEPLLDKKHCLPRQMLFKDLSRQIFPERVANRVVFDLDELTENTPPMTPNVSATHLHPSPSPVSSRVITPVLRKSQSAPKLSIRRGSSTSPLKDDILKGKPLSFESRFECGNLRKAIQIRHHEYDLILNSDTNTSQHHQWFYFQVQDMEIDVEYRFNIINCEKANSQFNYGMAPVMYSVMNAKCGDPSWERTGTNICYYRNHYTRGATSLKSYYTATFSITFPHKSDVCYLAYHYPYSLSMLKTDLLKLESSLPRIIYTNQVMCRTLGGNDINLLTITNPSISGERRDIYKRPYIFLTARVHPGESNSSWIMKGLLDFLVSSETIARQLRSIFIFKIVPMLNPDGVVNGCHRCSLTGQDLNRQWKNPDPVLHPSIYHVKSLIQTMTSSGKKPLLFVDFHGHSRKKNVFMYGCQAKREGAGEEESASNNGSGVGLESVSNWDSCSSESAVKVFPRIMSSLSPYFSLQNCSFTMEKSKEATARIVGFRELGIERCYTLESSYCGMDQGELAGYHMNTKHLQDVGRTFCNALFKFAMCPTVEINDLSN